MASGAGSTTDSSYLKARLSGGRGKSAGGTPCTAVARVVATAVTTSFSTALPTWSLGSAASAAVPAAQICGVNPTNVSVELFSELPVLPATGRPPMIESTCSAVPPSHLPKKDCWPTGQRAASVAAAATFGSIAWWQVGLAAG